MRTTAYITAALVALVLSGCAAGVKAPPAHPAPTVQATPAPARVLAAPVLARVSR